MCLPHFNECLRCSLPSRSKFILFFKVSKRDIETGPMLCQLCFLFLRLCIIYLLEYFAIAKKCTYLAFACQLLLLVHSISNWILNWITDCDWMQRTTEHQPKSNKRANKNSCRGFFFFFYFYFEFICKLYAQFYLFKCKLLNEFNEHRHGQILCA